MKYKTLIKLLPSIVLLVCSCRSSTATYSQVIDYDLVKRSGWKVGQVYKTTKPGGIVNESGELYLYSPDDKSFIATAYEDYTKKADHVVQLTPPGTLFRLERIHSTGPVNFFHDAVAKQLNNSPLKGEVDISFFGYDVRVRANSIGSMCARNPQYLVPVSSPAGVAPLSLPKN